MTTTHSSIGASSMHRWAECPGSVRLSKGMPNKSSAHAEEGTEAHELAADLLMIELRGNDGGDIADFQAKWKDVDDEMLEAVTVYTTAFLESAKDSNFFLVEEGFDLSNLHPDLRGTSDGIIYKESQKLLEVWDYKHGRGIPVEVENNEQLMYYGLGALMKTKVPCAEIELVIAQPRCPHHKGPIRRWRLTTVELMDFVEDLIDAAKRTEDPNAPLKSGDHCRFCPAASLCPKLHETAIDAAKNDFSPAFSYDPALLAATLEKLPAIEAWVKSVKEFAFSEAQHGRVPPGYKLVPNRPHRKWKDKDSIEAMLAFDFNIKPEDMKKPAALKSPAQIEALLSKEDKVRLAELTTKDSSGSVLAPTSDKREARVPAVETQFKIIPGDET
jgi:hypothetical protein